MRRHNHPSIPFLFLVFSTFSLHLTNYRHVSGRKLFSQTTTDFSSSTGVIEEKPIWRGQVGSRPPRCERRCGGCGHCEAVQVPTSPKVKSTAAASTEFDSNYKPLSWKCKCGNLIFNP